MPKVMPAAGRARSYVDPTTNTVVLSDFDLRTYLAWAKGRPVAGSGVLANFLHEWTHRWCFHSLVGTALALLSLRAAVRASNGKPAVVDHVIGMTTTQMLEPLAEGLSLFAEFDAYPGKSAWMSQTLTAAMLYFSPALVTPGKPLLLLEGMLQTLRREPALLERKAGIYARPASDPYLLGYLAVKSLWCQLAAACDALNDRDLFLSYLRSYIYDDPALVALVLHPFDDEIRAGRTIVNHINARFSQLVSFEGLSERVARWIASAQEGKIDVTTIGATPQQEAEAAQAVNAAIVADVEQGDEASLNVAAWIYATLEERSLCAIASTAVDLRLSARAGDVDVVVPATGETFATLPAAVPAGSTAGQLFLFSTADAHGMLVLLGVGRESWKVSSVGRYTAEELKLAQRIIANREISESVLTEFRAALRSSAIVDVAWQIVQPKVAGALAVVYGPLCTLSAAEAEWKAAFAALQPAGIFGLLESDGELTRALALVGLVNSFSSHVGDVRIAGKILDVDPKAIETALRLESRQGLRLVARRGDSVMALV